MGDISMACQSEILPEKLRTRFGSRVGNEIWFLTRVINKNDTAIKLLMNTVSELNSEEQRLEFINTVWRCHYENVAWQIVGQKIVK